MRSVCKACNGGWMSELENIAIPVVSRLILPRDPFTVISEDELVVVASWLWKVCIVAELATGARYFNDAHEHCPDHPLKSD
jgi:hypothetical protein